MDKHQSSECLVAEPEGRKRSGHRMEQKKISDRDRSKRQRRLEAEFDKIVGPAVEVHLIKHNVVEAKKKEDVHEVTNSTQLDSTRNPFLNRKPTIPKRPRARILSPTSDYGTRSPTVSPPHTPVHGLDKHAYTPGKKCAKKNPFIKHRTLAHTAAPPMDDAASLVRTFTVYKKPQRKKVNKLEVQLQVKRLKQELLSRYNIMYTVDHGYTVHSLKNVSKTHRRSTSELAVRSPPPSRPHTPDLNKYVVLPDIHSPEMVSPGVQRPDSPRTPTPPVGDHLTTTFTHYGKFPTVGKRGGK